MYTNNESPTMNTATPFYLWQSVKVQRGTGCDNTDAPTYDYEIGHIYRITRTQVHVMIRGGSRREPQRVFRLHKSGDYVERGAALEADPSRLAEEARRGAVHKEAA